MTTYIYNALGVSTITPLNTCKEPARRKIITRLCFSYVEVWLRNKKKCKYQQFDVDIVPPAYNFFKNKTPAQVFSYESCKFFQLVTL